MEFTEFIMSNYGIEYKKETNAWVGEFKLNNKYKGFYYYFVIKNNDIQFYTHEFEKVGKYLKEDFGIVNEKEGKEKLEEMNDFLHEFMYQKSADPIISTLLYYVEKLHTIKDKDLKEKVVMGYNNSEEGCGTDECYFCDVSIKHFPFFVWVEADEEGINYYLWVKEKEFVESDSVRGGFRIHNVHHFLGESFKKRFWEEIKKQSKYRLRLLQLHV